MKSICLLVPVYNEEKNLPSLVREVSELMKTLDFHWTFMFVDDGSKDESWKTIGSLKAQGAPIHAIRLTRNFGKEIAIMAGLDAVHADAVILMDADLQHPPSLIPQLVSRWADEGSKIVEGVKVDRGKESWLYRVFSNMYYSILFHWSGYDIQNSSDFKLMDRTVVDAIKSMPEKNIFFRGMAAWSGFPVDQVQFQVQNRLAGKRNISLRARIRLALLSIVSFTTAPLKWIFRLAILFIFSSLLFGAYSLYLKFMDSALPGFTTVIILQLFIGGAVLFALGIIGGYLAKIYDEVKGRPRYFVLEKAGFSEEGK